MKNIKKTSKKCNKSTRVDQSKSYTSSKMAATNIK